MAKAEASSHVHLADYSSLFGEEFRIPDDHWDTYCLNVLDVGVVEEGILHVLYACASQVGNDGRMYIWTGDKERKYISIQYILVI